MFQAVVRWLRQGLARAILWSISTDLDNRIQSYRLAMLRATSKMLAEQGDNVVRESVRAVDMLRNQLAALQALDVNFRDPGRIILLAKVDGKDVVKVIEVAPRMTLEQYRYLSTELEDRYGVRSRIIDGPPGLPAYFFAPDAGDSLDRRRRYPPI